MEGVRVVEEAMAGTPPVERGDAEDDVDRRGYGAWAVSSGGGAGCPAGAKKDPEGSRRGASIRPKKGAAP